MASALAIVKTQISSSLMVSAKTVQLDAKNA